MGILSINICLLVYYYGIKYKHIKIRTVNVFILIKTKISNLVRMTRVWNNLQQVRSKSKDWKAK